MGRKRGSRFRRAVDAQEQLEDIEKAQVESRAGKGRKKIDFIDKSRKRFDNAVNKLRTPEQVREEFPSTD